MPRTKGRTSSKKKKKKQQQRKPDDLFAMIQALANGKAKKAAFNSQDSLELALGWIDGGKVDAKRLAKNLPNTARDLRDGACNPNDLADFLSDMSHGSKHLRFSLGSFGVVATADMRTGSEHVVTLLARTVPHLEADGELFRRFQSTLHKCLKRRFPSLTRANEPWVIYNVKVAFDETCKKWEDTLTEQLYDGRAGAFRQACPMFGATLEAFDKIIEESSRWFRILHEELYAAALGVSMGLDQINDACWECDSVLGDVKRCRGCDAALYCCRTCQKSAWKAGHNKKCSLLAVHNYNLKAYLAIVDSAHSNNGLMHGLQLQPNLDSSIALGCSRWPCIQNKLRLFEGNDVPDPSIKAFYENLGRIACGEWWIYSDTIGFEEYNAHLSQGGHSDTDRFLMLSFLLCFECSDAAVGNVITDPEAINAEFFRTSFDATSWRDFSENMPAARYLQCYQTFDKFVNDRNRKVFRKYEKCAAQKELRLKFHK